MIYLADTNVLLRLVHRADARHGVIRKALRQLRAEGHSIQAAGQNFVEFWNVVTRPKDQNGFGLTPSEAQRLLRLAERVFPKLPYIPGTYEIWRRLVTTFDVSGVQTHDAHLVAAMRSHEISHILTLNTKHFVRYAA